MSQQGVVVGGTLGTCPVCYREVAVSFSSQHSPGAKVDFGEPGVCDLFKMAPHQNLDSKDCSGVDEQPLNVWTGKTNF